MLKHLRPMLALSAVLLAAGATGQAVAAGHFGFAHPGVRIVRPGIRPGIVRPPVIAPNAPVDFARRRHLFLRRFNNQTGFGNQTGVGGFGNFPAAVIDQAPPGYSGYSGPIYAPGGDNGGADQSPYVIDAGPRFRAPPNPGPLIITLPDLPKGVHRPAIGPALPRAAAVRPALRYSFTHRHHRWWDWRGFAARARAYHPSPLALIPCSFGRPGAIYNTPCGVYLHAYLLESSSF
jgi:hypothetical protein